MYPIRFQCSVFSALFSWTHILDTGCKLNLHKRFRKSPGHPLNVLCAFNSALCPGRTPYAMLFFIMSVTWLSALVTLLKIYQVTLLKIYMERWPSG